MSHERIIAAVVTVTVLLGAAAFGWFVYQTPGTIFDDGAEQRVEPLDASGEPLSVTIEQGASIKAIGGQLQSEGIIRSGRLFEVLVGLTGLQDAMQAGDYEFDRGIPAIDAVQRIAQGRTASRSITIREGLRAEEIGADLEAAGIVTQQEFLAALVKSQYNEPFLAESASTSLDGFLFPARYEFNRDADAGQVVATLLRGFQDNVWSTLQFEGQDLTLDEAVTLAAIVEREAVTASERPLIAGVFLNRLRLGIALQADPTVQYAVSQDPAAVAQYGYWKRDLTLDDLQIDSPYNTYVYQGLTPGPIANPGRASIEAVVRPEQTNYLYFVSKNDGTHVFAETLEEHLQNVAIYQQ